MRALSTDAAICGRTVEHEVALRPLWIGTGSSVPHESCPLTIPMSAVSTTTCVEEVAEYITRIGGVRARWPRSVATQPRLSWDPLRRWPAILWLRCCVHPLSPRQHLPQHDFARLCPTWPNARPTLRDLPRCRLAEVIAVARGCRCGQSRPPYFFCPLHSAGSAQQTNLRVRTTLESFRNRRGLKWALQEGMRSVSFRVNCTLILFWIAAA